MAITLFHVCHEYVMNMSWICHEYVIKMSWICHEYVINLMGLKSLTNWSNFRVDTKFLENGLVSQFFVCYKKAPHLLQELVLGAKKSNPFSHNPIAESRKEKQKRKLPISCWVQENLLCFAKLQEMFSVRMSTCSSPTIISPLFPPIQCLPDALFTLASRGLEELFLQLCCCVSFWFWRGIGFGFTYFCT